MFMIICTIDYMTLLVLIGYDISYLTHQEYESKIKNINTTSTKQTNQILVEEHMEAVLRWNDD